MYHKSSPVQHLLLTNTNTSCDGDSAVQMSFGGKVCILSVCRRVCLQVVRETALWAVLAYPGSRHLDCWQRCIHKQLIQWEFLNMVITSATSNWLSFPRSCSTTTQLLTQQWYNKRKRRNGKTKGSWEKGEWERKRISSSGQDKMINVT